MIEQKPSRIIQQLILFGYDLFERIKPSIKRLYKEPLIYIASAYRGILIKTVFIGVTGSGGKTTTKDLIDAALSEKYSGSKSEDSNNQLYGIARTVLSLKPWSHYCVQELGVFGPGSLDRLLQCFRPNIGVVINIGSDHYKSFRTLEATAQEKGKLIEALPESGTAILNADDPHVLAMKSCCKASVITFGVTSDALFRAENISGSWPDRLSFNLYYQEKTYPVQTRLCGTHWVSSILPALATAVVMGESPGQAIKGVEKLDPFLSRMYPMEFENGITFIRDDWKAPYWSIPLALDFMKTARAQRKLMIIGTLSDYAGSSSPKYRLIAKQALEVADVVFFVGKQANSVQKLCKEIGGDRLKVLTDIKEATDYIQQFLNSGDLVFIKSSGADHLARIALATDKKIECWDNNCHKIVICDRCYKLCRAPSAPMSPIEN